MKNYLLMLVLLFVSMFAVACGEDYDDYHFEPDGDKEQEMEIEEEISEASDGDMDADLDKIEEEAEIEVELEVEEELEAEDESDPLKGQLVQKAGFVEIEPIDYSFKKGTSETELTSTAARLWYFFQPADENPEDKPLAIFFNGGPGSATGLLFGFNTAKKTLDPQVLADGETMIDNPHSWSKIANLIYVDARQTGFSHCTMENADDLELRKKEFAAKNFNSMFDAADFIRLMLRFLADHPQIQKNPVMIVGESYGGIRATAMLNILLNYKAFADGSRFYHDALLGEEIQTHLETVFPEFTDKEVPKETIANQFSHQVLIQPLLSGIYQDDVTAEMLEKPGSPLYTIAEEENITYSPCSAFDPNCDPYNNIIMFLFYESGRDPYNYSMPVNWMDELYDVVIQNMLQKENLDILSGIDSSEISQLYAENRIDAYRMADLDVDWAKKSAKFELTQKVPLAVRDLRYERQLLLAQLDPSLTMGNLPDTFGSLQLWDRYYVALNRAANLAFRFNELLAYEIDPWNTLYGDMFLENLLYVKTFVTNAAYDLVIYSNAIPDSLAMHTNIVESYLWQQELQEGEQRPGHLTINYKQDSFEGVASGTTRTFRFAEYPVSCHAVEMTEPEELLYDVTEWLNDNNK